MSELDKHFGEKEKPDIPDFKPTLFGEFRPPRIRVLCDAWLDEYLEDNPSVNITQHLLTHIAGEARQLVKWLDTHGISESQYKEFVVFACKLSRANKLDRDGPMSIKYAVKHFNGREENRDKYLKGVE